ncbi:unnamed protein product [Brachionus calyciflorus]|uniref:Uncharacterized protein n=1 Tax=Brachionus calyciflorus TaxID=104777 RepID=A0A814KG37_9BILA|nr:unnamed protein product [Brachionus calyciflorus]
MENSDVHIAFIHIVHIASENILTRENKRVFTNENYQIKTHEIYLELVEEAEKLKSPFLKKYEDNSLVVYKIKCENCEANNVGKCKRILSYRISEHKKLSESSCCQHDSSTGHTMDYDNIEIIFKADTDMKLRIIEFLHILKRKPSLKKQLNSQSNYEIKTHIIQAYPQL